MIAKMQSYFPLDPVLVEVEVEGLWCIDL